MSELTKVLENVAKGQCSAEEAEKMIAKLKLAETKRLRYQVSDKGAISFYGIRRMPISLYKEELETIVSTVNSPEFRQFLVDNQSKLSTKKKAQ